MEVVEQGTYSLRVVSWTFHIFLNSLFNHLNGTHLMQENGAIRNANEKGRCNSLQMDFNNGGMQLINITKPTSTKVAKMTQTRVTSLQNGICKKIWW
jgi:hypothetical protein